ncbi:hypothetical protein GQ42DRAFT_157720 [Ramicandelaber brevisporus]|nr:hypothetical protein GQ42DRAFT_157720 [Ramicandelaber brevisporus]
MQNTRGNAGSSSNGQPADTERFERARAALYKPDGLMEPSVFTSIVDFVKLGGRPAEVVSALSNNYTGLAPMCNLLMNEWAPLFGIAEPEIEKIGINALRPLLFSSFSSSKLDATYREALGSGGGDTVAALPRSLITMTTETGSRKLLYELAATHSDSAALDAVMSYVYTNPDLRDEIAALPHSSAYVQVHLDNLESSLAEVLKCNLENGEDDSVQMNEFLKLSAQNGQTYAMSHYLISKLMHQSQSDDKNNINSSGSNTGLYPLRRIQNRLTEYMLQQSRRSAAFVTAQELLRHTPSIDPELIDEIYTQFSMLNGQSESAPTTGNIVGLHALYSKPSQQPGTESVPPSDLLRNPGLIEGLIDVIFINNERLRQNKQPQKYLWVLAKAASGLDNHEMNSNESADKDSSSPHTTARGEKRKADTLEQQQQQQVPPSSDSFQSTLNALTQLYEFIGTRQPGVSELDGLCSTIVPLIDIPVVSAAAISWIGSMLRTGSFDYYETYFQQASVPRPLLLLEEIAYRHPLLCPRIFSVLVESMDATIEEFKPELRLALKKCVLMRMISLLHLGYVRPVLQFVAARSSSLDMSLVDEVIAEAKRVGLPKDLVDIVASHGSAMDTS